MYVREGLRLLPHFSRRESEFMSTTPFIVRVTVATLLVIAIAVAAYFVWQVRSILLLLAIGILFGSILEPLVNRLRRIGFSRGQALLSWYVILFGIVGVAIYYFSPLLARQISNFDAAIPEIFESLRQTFRDSGNETLRRSG